MLGPIKQECRSQLKPEVLRKPTPLGQLSSYPEGSWLRKKHKKKQPGFLCLPLTSPPPPFPQIHPWREGWEPWEGHLPLCGGNQGRRLIRCLHPIYVLFVKAPVQLQPWLGPLPSITSASYFTAPELVSPGQNVSIIILSLPLPL